MGTNLTGEVTYFLIIQVIIEYGFIEHVVFSIYGEHSQRGGGGGGGGLEEGVQSQEK